MPWTGSATPERFHLTLTSAGRQTVHGWWGSEATARRKVSSWVREFSGMPDVRITLVDEETGETLTTWPEGT